jgi:hypothetical protein
VRAIRLDNTLGKSAHLAHQATSQAWSEAEFCETCRQPGCYLYCTFLKRGGQTRPQLAVVWLTEPDTSPEYKRRTQALPSLALREKGYRYSLCEAPAGPL